MTKQIRKPIAIAAVLALCICLPLGAAAAEKLGFFRDVIRWDGAVVGTTYENATEEIYVSVSAEEGDILVAVQFLKPEAFPYREMETLALGSCRLTDAAGNCIAELTGTEAEPINGRTVTFRLDPEEGAHLLHIEYFIGGKKAEQPLPIYGDWVIEIK